MTAARPRSLARTSARGLLLGALACLGGDPSSPPRAADKPATARCAELGTINPWADRAGARTLADRGALVGCVHAATSTAGDVSRSPFFLPALGPPIGGYELFVIQYVTEARPGVARAATALAYLPSGGATDVPIVAINHATSGMGPTCGPSHLPILSDPFAVPLVGRGYAVVAPDYAGMGVDTGMTSYLVGAAEAAATLDAVRALRRLHDPRFDAAQLGPDFFVAGYSQGGHAALFAHQLFVPEAGERLLGSIAISPGLGSARRWAAFFTDPARPVRSMETFALMSLYAHMMHAGAPAPGAWLTPRAQAMLPAMLHDACGPGVVLAVSTSFPTLADLYQASFLAAAAGCAFSGACPDFEPWASALVAEQPGDIAGDVPSLVLQGLADPIVPAETTACIVDRMKARGAHVQACGYAGFDHFNVLVPGVPDMIRWIAARRAGRTLDVCPAPLGVACADP